MESQPFRVVVDKEKCFSFGFCMDIAPEVFSWDDDGLSVAGSGSAESRVAAFEAMDACPRAAIAIVDGVEE